MSYKNILAYYLRNIAISLALIMILAAGLMLAGWVTGLGVGAITMIPQTAYVWAMAGGMVGGLFGGGLAVVRMAFSTVDTIVLRARGHALQPMESNRKPVKIAEPQKVCRLAKPSYGPLFPKLDIEAVNKVKNDDERDVLNEAFIN